MIRSLIILLLLIAPVIGADWTVPAVNQGYWTAGTYTGISGGIDQYRVGGASARTTLLDVTQSPYSADKTGVTDATSAINAAISAATSGQVIYLPAGIYRTDGAIVVGQGRDNITIRGDGPTLTKIASRSASAVLTVGQGFAFAGNSQAVTGTKTKGTANLAVASSSGFAVGQIVRLAVENNDQNNAEIQAGAAIRFSVFGYANAYSPIHQVSDVPDSTHITIEPPLLLDATGYDVTITNMQSLPDWRVKKFGLEDLEIDGLTTPTPNGVNFGYTDQCWIYNCKITGVNNYPVFGNYAYRCEVRGNYLGEVATRSGSNKAGVLWNTCTSGLIVDNIIVSATPLVEENQASTNNVWAYNYLGDQISDGFLLNHGEHNSHNLFEGNIANNWKSDGYFGSCANNTMFRNWFRATNRTNDAADAGFSANRFTRKFAIAGNLLGTDGLSGPGLSYGNPNIGNGGADGFVGPTGLSDQAGQTDYAQPGYGVGGGSFNSYTILGGDIFTGDFWIDWTKTGTVASRASDTQCTVTVSHLGGFTVGLGAGNNGPSLIWPGGRYDRLQITAISGLDVTFQSTVYSAGGPMPSSAEVVDIYGGVNVYQERDMDVKPSFTFVENYHAAAVGTGSVQDGTVDVLPSSLVYTSKPDWFGSLTWPPINPDSPTFSAEIIPSGYRFVNASAPAPDTSGPTITTGSLSIGGTLSLGN